VGYCIYIYIYHTGAVREDLDGERVVQKDFVDGAVLKADQDALLRSIYSCILVRGVLYMYIYI